MKDKLLLFLDTNIFLHYQLFDQIDWSSVFDVQTVEIIIPPVTVHELNKHKDTHLRPRVRSRAADVIKKLLGLFENSQTSSISDALSVRLEDREPQIDFSQYQLSKEVSDDELIASILYFKTDFPTQRAVLVTSDFGLILLGKAKRQGIEAFKLPDSYKLPEEPDPNEKKVSELQAEINRIKNTMPKVSLVFDHGKDHISFLLKRPNPPLTATEIETKITEIKNEHPLIQNVQQKPQQEGLNLYRITSEDINLYNQELVEYYGMYSEFLQKRESYERFQALTLELSIWVSNRGTAPAEDMDIYLHFPDGFNLFPEERLPQPPQVPKAPKEPKSTLERLIGNPSIFSPDFSLMANMEDIHAPEPPSNISGLDIQRTHSYEVHFHVERLKHNIAEAADKIFINFASYDEAKSFEIEYSILVANLAKPTEGKLHVIVQKS